jgi:hypothetical protein
VIDARQAQNKSHSRAAFCDLPEEARNHANSREKPCFLAANTRGNYNSVRRSGFKPMHLTGLKWHSGVFFLLLGKTSASFAMCTGGSLEKGGSFLPVAGRYPLVPDVESEDDCPQCRGPA